MKNNDVIALVASHDVLSHRSARKLPSHGHRGDQCCVSQYRRRVLWKPLARYRRYLWRPSSKTASR